MTPPPCIRSWIGTLGAGAGAWASQFVSTATIAQAPAWLTWQNFSYAAIGIAALGSFALTMKTLVKGKQ